MRASRLPWRPFRRTALLLCLLLTTISAAGAAQVPQQVRPGQQLPTPDQAREMLQNQPDMVRQLRERLQESGLTDDQIRARLRAAGYPENILDQYLSGADTSMTVRPGPRTLDAVTALGILSPQEPDSLQLADSTFAMSDSLRQVLDSLRYLHLDSLRADSLADSLQAIRPGGLEALRHRDLPSPVHPVRADGCRAGGRELSAGPGRRTGPASSRVTSSRRTCWR